MKTLAAIFALLVMAVPASAQGLQPWRIVPGESRLGFTARDATGGAVTGGFGKFSGTILFDPERLAESRIVIDVEMASVQAGFPDAQAELPKPEWLAVKAFPAALYESRVIRKRPDGGFEAEGMLTLKGVSAPVTLLFSLPEYGQSRAVAKGTARLSRGAFKVGQGDLVADPVDLAFTVTAIR